MTGRARYVETDVGDGPPWCRVVCVETGESVDVRTPHPGHVLRSLALLSAECLCGGGWHHIEESNQTPAEAGGESPCRR